MTAGRRMGREFYSRQPEELAPHLLNKLIVHGERVARIVEVEAYGGRQSDPASHTFRGLTARTKAMFGPPGHLYVYFSYGVHWCANVVCGDDGEGAAVLLRAAAPVEGLAEMRADRATAKRDADLLRGPGNLTRALGITNEHYGADLVRADMGIELRDDGTSPGEIVAGPRIGITKAVDLPWRFHLAGEPSVSRSSRAAPKS
ncbi:MAG TPA: DNA-3-methyladenine glycosylase [Acidimicrobiales bacterium]|nr:DNA-3-methyladenine glycosylase [Acidimicrobiales bacterium]